MYYQSVTEVLPEYYRNITGVLSDRPKSFLARIFCPLRSIDPYEDLCLHQKEVPGRLLFNSVAVCHDMSIELDALNDYYEHHRLIRYVQNLIVQKSAGQCWTEQKRSTTDSCRANTHSTNSSSMSGILGDSTQKVTST